MTTTKSLVLTAAIAAAALFSAASVMAQEATVEYTRAPVVNRSTPRADVVAITAAAFARGELDAGTSARVAPVQFASTMTRAAVKAETVRALKAHEVLDNGELFSVAPSRFERSASR